VASLVAQGLSNKDIAARLTLSPRTVQHTLTAVFQKLGVGSRYEVIVAVLHNTVAQRPGRP
jgi:DNA-binding NarL/FixJ family response regulator